MHSYQTCFLRGEGHGHIPTQSGRRSPFLFTLRVFGLTCTKEQLSCTASSHTNGCLASTVPAYANAMPLLL